LSSACFLEVVVFTVISSALVSVEILIDPLAGNGLTKKSTGKREFDEERSE